MAGSRTDPALGSLARDVDSRVQGLGSPARDLGSLARDVDSRVRGLGSPARGRAGEPGGWLKGAELGTSWGRVA